VGAVPAHPAARAAGRKTEADALVLQVLLHEIITCLKLLTCRGASRKIGRGAHAQVHSFIAGAASIM
jgi:hypothetical protein